MFLTQHVFREVVLDHIEHAVGETPSAALLVTLFDQLAGKAIPEGLVRRNDVLDRTRQDVHKLWIRFRKHEQRMINIMANEIKFTL